jgi:hypothetical protein
MAEKEFLGDRRRSQEEEFFHKREQELIAKLRRRREDSDARERMIQRTGISDERTLHELESLGYTPETIVLLDLVPLVKVAWAEGNVSDRERQRLMEIARGRNIEEDSLADEQLAIWLRVRPTDDFLNRSLHVIGAMLKVRPERETTEQLLLEWSRSIASASGGVLGFGRISPEEEAALAEIHAQLTAAPPPEGTS